MKKKLKKVLTLMLASAMLLSAAACSDTGGKQPSSSPDASPSAAGAARTEPLVLRVGWPTSGQEGDVIMPGIYAMCDYVTEKTDGMITFEYFPNQQLGTESDMTDQLITGDLDLGVISGTVAAAYWPALYLYTMPFAFDSFQNFWDLCGSQGWNGGTVHNAVARSVEATGQVHFLGPVCATFRGLQSNGRAIRSLADFKGTTVRVQAGEIFSDIYYALGASTASIPFGELYTSMQLGTVDVEDVGISTSYSMRMYEVEEYATELNHCMTANVCLMSNKLFDSLTAEERTYFAEGQKLAEAAALEAVSSQDQVAYQGYADNDVEVIRYADLDSSAIDEMREATVSVWDKYRGLCGEEVFNAFEEALAAQK